MSWLPKNWIETELSNVAAWGSGGTPSRANSSYYGGYIPWIKTGELGQRYVVDTEEKITEEGVKNSSAKIFKKGSVAVAMYGATIGRTSILGIDATTNQACGVGTPFQGVTTSEYLYYYLSSQKEDFIEAGKGGAQPNISQSVIKSWPIPLAPLTEQKRIADKLDTVLARVDACRERLNRVPLIVKRFKQSVLAAATSGKLTEEWREKTNTKIGKRAFLGDMGKILAGQSPSVSEVNYEGRGEPYVTGPEQWDGKKILAHKWTEFPKRMAPDGSIFVTVKGAGVGKTFPGCHAAIGRDVYAFVPDVKHDHRFVLFAIQASAEAVVLKAKGLIPGLTKADIAEHEIYVPVLKEQQEIVRRVEILFVFADRLDNRLSTARNATERLTPALLAKAFRGELVDQDPNDEPAEILLKRIQSATSIKEKKISSPRKVMTKLSAESVKAVIHQMQKTRFSFDELRTLVPGDYDVMKDILFLLMAETTPLIRQMFDEDSKKMIFEKVNK